MTKPAPIYTFDALRDDHRARLGVTWMATPAFGIHAYSMMDLRRLKTAPKGNGATAMTELCALADRLGVTLELGTSIARLKPWYVAFGFRPTRELKIGPSYCATFFERVPR